MSKEREAFEVWFESQFESTKLDKFDDGVYLLERAQMSWQSWQAAKAQAVPDTYTPIVLALEDVQSKIAQASFLTMDADNENEVYAVDANELHEYIAELIEAQE